MKPDRTPTFQRILPWLVALLFTGGGLYAWWTQANYEQPVDRLVNFDQYHYGVVPPEFDYDAGGAHGPVLTAGRPYWRVYRDLFAPSPDFVLVQAAALAESDYYPLALLKDVQAKNVTLAVYLKPMGGQMDKSAGLIWRVQDKENYYAALASALDNRLHLLKMVAGQPTELAAVHIEIGVEFEQSQMTPTHGWYLLEVEDQGNQIKVRFQGKPVIEISDSAFTQAGRVGVATHADSIASFDNFHVQVGRQLIFTPTPGPTATPGR